MKQYDYLIVGAGLYGAVFAHEAKKAGRRCLVIDKRGHIAGNIYTEEVEGINVHRYGANDKIIVLFHYCLSFFFCSASDSRPLFFWASRYWSMAVWMRLRAASGVICLSWAAAMV